MDVLCLLRQDYAVKHVQSASGLLSMNNKSLDPEVVFDLVKEIQHEDPIDWSTLKIDKTAASRVIILSMIEQYQTNWAKLDEQQRDYALVATMSKLALENFVLNVRIRNNED